ncbi:hypothetical protein CEXT_162491 [Caerostris extrusa]|uniref:Uncharacterized protein n=1 Tax=Caerostris extrusa TaxID=172846 RepID=A0AAV4M7D9_CAEEX|nr:hypothetical protein CEXT_162491 [Caerostris extrusa]
MYVKKRENPLSIGPDQAEFRLTGKRERSKYQKEREKNQINRQRRASAARGERGSVGVAQFEVSDRRSEDVNNLPILTRKASRKTRETVASTDHYFTAWDRGKEKKKRVGSLSISMGLRHL